MKESSFVWQTTQFKYLLQTSTEVVIALRGVRTGGFGTAWATCSCGSAGRDVGEHLDVALAATPHGNEKYAVRAQPVAKAKGCSFDTVGDRTELMSEVERSAASITFPWSWLKALLT